MKYRMNKEELNKCARYCHSLQQHLDFFNLLDYASLTLFATVIVEEYFTKPSSSSAHNFLVLVSYIAALNLFSTFKPCRSNIDLII
jgi:hypothetical protein